MISCYRSLVLNCTVLGAFGAGTATAGASATINFVALSDVHLDETRPDSDYTHDTGTKLWGNARTKLHSILRRDEARFVIVLGDLPAHRMISQSRTPAIAEVLKDLRAAVGKRLPLFYVPGNNDALSGNYHSFSDKSGHNIFDLDPQGQWPGPNTISCETLASSDRPCIVDATADKKVGYYAAYPLGRRTKLKFVALNTVVLTRKYEPDDGVDQVSVATKQFAWLRQILDEAQAAKESVIIGMHVPPGFDSYADRPMWSARLKDKSLASDTFVALLKTHRDSIKLVLSGHTHMDELRLVKDAAGKIAVLGLSIPSLSPVHGNNPALRIVSLADSSWAPVDAKTYFSEPDAKVWGNESYAFAADYRCRKEQTLLDCLNDKPLPELTATMHGNYTARYLGKTPKWGPIDEAIFVDSIAK